MSRNGILLSALVGVALGLGTAHAQTGNTVWVSLPTNADLPDQLSNNAITELAYLDTRTAGKLRVYYTTQGYFDESPLQVWPGTLRPVDLPPIPVLDAMFGEWTPLGLNIWPSVANWNQVLDTTPIFPLYYGKRGSLNGMIAKEGHLFVAITQRHDWGVPPDITQVFDHKRGWNGFARLYGWDDPSDSFNPAQGTGQELHSAGFGSLYDHDDNESNPEDDGGLREGVPEGVAIAELSPPGASLDRWIFVANYCGRDAAGHVLIQRITSLEQVNPSERFMIPVYELLADWLESADAPPAGPLGHEVPRGFFTCPLDPLTQLPDCADGNDDIRGNKIRPLVVVTIQSSVPHNGGRTLLFIGINLDPIDILTYNDPDPVELDDIDVPSGFPTSRDDGKYDYVAIVDLTYMVEEIPNPAYQELWVYTDLAGWKANTTFVRLPPDVGAWMINPNDLTALPTVPGGDWTRVAVPHPTDPNQIKQVRILGSGTPKTMAVSSPLMNAAGVRKQYLYVLNSDQGQEGVAEQTSDDGGLHVPHLYPIDLGLVDLTDQQAINAALADPDFIRSYRFNKVVKAEFEPGVEGAVAIEDELLLPGSTKTMVSHALMSEVGPYYPGEYQFEPTARARMHFVHNDDLLNDPNRLYIGTTGESQDSSTNAAFKAIDGWQERLGTVLVLKVDNEGVPTYREVMTLQKNAPHFYAVSALDVVPGMFVEGTPKDRNVLLVGALDKLGAEAPAVRQDRIVLMQDR